MILYNYDFSNYSEKIRLLLGYKGVSWKSVEVPSYGHKPGFTHLTGGYRRAPVLQIGADVYCDTRLIAEVLESLFPNQLFILVPVSPEQRHNVKQLFIGSKIASCGHLPYM